MKLRPGFHIEELRPGIRARVNERRGWMVWEIGSGSVHGFYPRDCSNWNEDTFSKTRKHSLELWRKSRSPFEKYISKKVRIFRVAGDLSRLWLLFCAPTRCPLRVQPRLPPTPRFVYSTRRAWYPQSATSDYATATLRITTPGIGRLVIAAP
jgi:hypothetical protein